MTLYNFEPAQSRGELRKKQQFCFNASLVWWNISEVPPRPPSRGSRNDDVEVV